MSLINDALKRTRTAQQESAPVAGGPTLQPAPSTPTPSAGGSKMLFYLLIGCVVIGNLFLFLYASKRDEQKPGPVAVEARELPATPPVTPVPAPTPAPPTGTAVAAAAPAGVESAASTASADPVATNEPPPVVFVTPQPVPLRLQSIVMNAARPSAMISGKFLFVGDRIQGYRLTAISRESVTLVGNGQTNVLVLP